MNSLEPDPQKKEKEDADDDVFPFFGNSSLVLACGGPHIGQIILSYCDAIVSAFVRLHQLETQERKKPLASIELLLQRSSHTRCEDRFYQHLTTYIDWFYALEQERAQEEPENYKYHFLEIQDKLNSYFEGKTRNLRDLSNQCLADQCSDRLRTLMMEWVAGKNVHNLPVNRWMTKDQMQKLLDATTIKLSVDHYRGHLYTSPPLFEVTTRSINNSKATELCSVI
jgi:hypothetical protein